MLSVTGGSYCLLIRYQGGNTPNTLAGMVTVKSGTGRAVFKSAYGAGKTRRIGDGVFLKIPRPQFANQWQKLRVLLSNDQCVDSTFLKYNDKNYLTSNT